jgi:transposase
MRFETFIRKKERAMGDLTTIGIDIAKNYIQIHGQDSRGKMVLKKRLQRERFLPYMANLPKCLIGMEACGGAHYWAQQLTTLGFTVKLMSPRKVKKYVENNKNDEKDAEACAEAVGRSNMRFVSIKTKTQLDIQAIHRVRSCYVKQKTGMMNMIRGLLLETGIAIPKGEAALIKRMRMLLETENNQLSGIMKNMLQNIYEHLQVLDKEVESYKAVLEKLSEEDEYAKRLKTLPGIGPITATGIIAKIGNGSEFKKGRDLSAYLGLVPKQHSSGEKQILGGISKHGDRYIRQLLIHGGRSALKAARKKNQKTGLFKKEDEHSRWMRKLCDRIGMNKASVAVANKNARMIVDLLKNETTFQPELAH